MTLTANVGSPTGYDCKHEAKLAALCRPLAEWVRCRDRARAYLNMPRLPDECEITAPVIRDEVPVPTFGQLRAISAALGINE